MASSCPPRLHPRLRLRPSSHLPLVVSSLALAAIAACEPARSADGPVGGPLLGGEYHLTLRTGTMASVIPRWPFGETAAWGVVRLPRDAGLDGGIAAGTAHMTWHDTTLGDLRLAGLMNRDGGARGEWTRVGADGRVLAHGRFDLRSMYGAAHGVMLRTRERPAAARLAPDTIAR